MGWRFRKSFSFGPFGQPLLQEDLEKVLAFWVFALEYLQTAESIGALVFVGLVCITSSIYNYRQNHKVGFRSL